MQNSHARRFSGIVNLYGLDSFSRINQAKICVIGLGGVGSWVVEALARSGIGHLTLIDLDHIAESNINRQIQALEADLGKSKVVALKNRVGAIDPAIIVTPIEAFAEPNNLSHLINSDWDWVIDCIDGSRNKAALIAHCRQIGLRIISAGGAGGRIDPSRIRVADLSRTGRDQLLAKTRNRLRREYGFPSHTQGEFGVPCVYSDEVPIANDLANKNCSISEPAATGSGLNCSGYGSVVTVTASFGFMAASVVLNQLALNPDTR